MNKAMDNYLKEIFNEKINKIVISNPNKNTSFHKIVVENKGEKFLVSKYTKTQVFNDNIILDELKNLIINAFGDFKQINLWSDNNEYMLKLSKKNKIFFTKLKTNAKTNISQTHNREKNYILKEGSLIPPLVDMGLLSTIHKVFGCN